MSGVRVNLGTGVVNTAIVVEKLLAMPRTTLAATVILCAAYSFSLLPPSKIKHKMTATELTVENRKFHWLWKGWEGDQVNVPAALLTESVTLSLSPSLSLFHSLSHSLSLTLSRRVRSFLPQIAHKLHRRRLLLFFLGSAQSGTNCADFWRNRCVLLFLLSLWY